VRILLVLSPRLPKLLHAHRRAGTNRPWKRPAHRRHCLPSAALSQLLQAKGQVVGSAARHGGGKRNEANPRLVFLTLYYFLRVYCSPSIWSKVSGADSLDTDHRHLSAPKTFAHETVIQVATQLQEELCETGMRHVDLLTCNRFYSFRRTAPGADPWVPTARRPLHNCQNRSTQRSNTRAHTQCSLPNSHRLAFRHRPGRRPPWVPTPGYRPLGTDPWAPTPGRRPPADRCTTVKTEAHNVPTHVRTRSAPCPTATVSLSATAPGADPLGTDPWVPTVHRSCITRTVPTSTAASFCIPE